MRGEKFIQYFGQKTLNGTDHLEDIGIDGVIILEWILRNYGGRVWTGFIWLRTGTGGASCEHGNEASGSTKSSGFLD
jgi:hypothetical protein